MFLDAYSTWLRNNFAVFSGCLLGVAGAASAVAANTTADTSLRDGAVYVESSARSGVSIDGQNLRQDQVFVADGQRLATGAEGSILTLVYSNGVAMTLGSRTEVALLRFAQEPFTASEEDILFEPSRSELRIQLTAGTLALRHRSKKPSSTILIETAAGAIQCDTRYLVVQYTERDGLSLQVYAGTALFFPPGNRPRQAILAGEILSIGPGEGKSMPAIRQANRLEFERFASLLLMAERSSERVFFQTEGSGETWAIHPLRVLPIDFFEGNRRSDFSILY